MNGESVEGGGEAVDGSCTASRDLESGGGALWSLWMSLVLSLGLSLSFNSLLD